MLSNGIPTGNPIESYNLAGYRSESFADYYNGYNYGRYRHTKLINYSASCTRTNVYLRSTTTMAIITTNRVRQPKFEYHSMISVQSDYDRTIHTMQQRSALICDVLCNITCTVKTICCVCQSLFIYLSK